MRDDFSESVTALGTTADVGLMAYQSREDHACSSDRGLAASTCLRVPGCLTAANDVAAALAPVHAGAGSLAFSGYALRLVSRSSGRDA